VLGETITPIEIGGAVLVIAGLVVTLLRGRPVEPAIRLD
jgi:O-acetylserine/cysteine efflux transporter